MQRLNIPPRRLLNDEGAGVLGSSSSSSSSDDCDARQCWLTFSAFH
jgi:hypothetical protein